MLLGSCLRFRLSLFVRGDSLSQFHLQRSELLVQLCLLYGSLVNLFLVSLGGLLGLASVLGLLRLRVLDSLLNRSSRGNEFLLERRQTFERLRVLISGSLLVLLQLENFDLELRNLGGLLLVLGLQLRELGSELIDCGCLLLQLFDLSLGLIPGGFQSLSLCLEGLEVGLRLKKNSVLSFSRG